MITSKDQLKIRHGFVDYLYWNLFGAIHIIAAGTAILNHSIACLVCYIILGISLVVLVYRFYCSHCPHYGQGDKTTKCMFFWGIPAFFKPRPWPLNLFEKAVLVISSIVWILFPLYWLSLEPSLLVIYLLSLAVFVWTIRRNECCRCIYFHSPVNCVPKEIRSQPETH